MHNIFSEDAILKLANVLSNHLAQPEKYIFSKTYNIKCGKIYVKSFGDDAIIYLDQCIDKKYVNLWRNTSIKILLKDLKHKTLDNYYVVSFENVYYLLRLLDDDAIAYLKKKNIQHPIDLESPFGKYAIISISSDDKFISTCGTNDYEFEGREDEEIDDENDNTEVELDSLQLFNEDDLVL